MHVLQQYLSRLRESIIHTVEDLKRIEAAEIVIVSPPKTGRTWLRVILTYLFHIQYGSSLHSLTTFSNLPPSAPRIEFSHYLFCPFTIYTRRVRIDASLFRGKRIIFLARDPRDTLTSYYFHLTKRTTLFQGSLSELLRHPRFGLGRLVRFMNSWEEYGKTSLNFLILRYEDLHSESKNETVEEFIRFLGISASREQVEAAINFGAFDNMQHMEKEGFFRASALRPADFEDPQSYKVREGRIGSYQKHFSSSDIAYANNILKKLNPIYRYN